MTTREKREGPRRSELAAALRVELDERTRELAEAREQQTVIADILRAISSSPGDVQPVLDTVAKHAARICEAQFVDVIVVEDGMIRVGAKLGELWGLPDGEPIALDRTTVAGRSICDKQTVHVADLQSTDNDFPFGRKMAIAAGTRTVLGVPLLREGNALATILVRRTEVRPFEDKHIALLGTFADQAAIAIENTRLFDELRQRTDELTESLEQQTATSEVLKVISSSPNDLEPVLQALLAKATQLCEAKYGSLILSEGDAFRIVAMHNAPPALVESRKRDPSQLLIRSRGPAGVLGRIVKTKDVVQIADLTADQAYFDRMPARVALVEAAGYRSLLSVPMLKDDVLIGLITIFRQEVGLFADKQVALVKDFAAQAVIAIENTRLLNELRQRTDDLSESLEQQTATSEVLRVISSSPGDLEPVFTSMLENAVRICGAKFGVLMLAEGDAYRIVALHGAPPAYAEYRRREPLVKPSPGRNLTRVAATKQAAQIEDLRVNAADPNLHGIIHLAEARTMLNVPMLKDNELVGQIVFYRQEVRLFTDKQVSLLENFAAQAVIAIENARLLTELRQRTDDLSEALEHQTATSEVLKVISSSRGDLAPVFNALLDNAARICDAQFGTLFWYDGEVFHVDAMLGAPPAFEALARSGPRRPTPLSALWRIVAERRPVHIVDVVTERAYLENDPRRRELVDLGGARTFLAVPMLRNAELVGALAIYRQEVRPFSDKQIELVENFAAQAVIAIENARLLNEVREQAGQLEAQSQELRTLNQQLEQRVDEQVGEIERMGRLRRFLSPQVADLIVSSGGEKQLESHRREISALFCDLRDFTGFSETSDPEDVMALLREYHKAIGEIVFRHGGTLERFAGDGVMVILGDPVPLENPALTAVTMALEMRAAIGALIEKWRRLGHDLGFGVGIAQGYATLGTVGFEGRFDYGAIGNVTNVASRLCDEAQPGQILISPRVLLAVESAVLVEAVAEMSLKGIRRPLQVHNVVAHRAADDSV